MGKGMRAGKRKTKMGGGDMQKQLKQMQAMQREMEQSQAELAEREFTSTAGGGAVEVVINGNKEITKLNIDKDVVDPDDVEMLQDLLIAAVNEGMRQVDTVVEQEMSKIHVGSPATITFWALPDVKVQGVVREISPVPDPVARTYTVKIALQNAPSEVQLGMTVNVNLTTTDTSNISIPLTALVKDSNGNNAVYIIRDKKAHLVPIKTGDFGQNSVIVTSGLAKGDIVITAGTQQLQEGTAVSQ